MNARISQAARPARSGSPADSHREADLLAELGAARARVRQLEEELTTMLASPTWRLALRIRRVKQAMTELGPPGRLLDLLIRMIRILRREGVAGLRRRLHARYRPPAPVTPPSHDPAPAPLPMTVPPLTDPHGVSIVIPVFNNASLTFKCLSALVERTPAGRYEVIVVDNASTDDTDRLLAQVSGLRVIRNAENRVFVDACNQGAQLARGEFILFLNNDTVVLPGWLEPLVDTLQHDATVGVVGSQLLYPDGRLQEAGGIIWKDGHGWNYGRGDDPNCPEYRYTREVDFCSGACLLVRRQLFEEIGGFDQRYAPAYYEDVDLCFEARRRGARVVYQPRSRIVHIEGATAGTDLGAGFKRFQEVNRLKFLAKHAAALEGQQVLHPDRFHRARDRRPGQRILIIDGLMPRYDRDAGSLRMFELLRIFGDLGHAPTFVPDHLLPPLEPYTSALQQRGVEVVHASVADYLDRHLDKFDLVVLCRASIAIKYMSSIVARPVRPPVIFDTVDLHYLREERRAALDGDPALVRQAATTKSAEIYLARACDMVWVVSPYEAEVLRREDGGLRVEVVPLIHRVRERIAPLAGRRDIMFIGGFAHPPNQDAVLYFVREIFPLVKRALPDVRFVVVGPDAPSSVEALASEDVVLTGYVERVEPLFDSSRVLVAPLRYGAGLKGKITHSLALGLPVVTTSVGAEGLDLVDEEHALIADGPETFAARVVDLYRDADLWHRLSSRGRVHLDTRFGYEPVKRIVDGLLRVIAR